LPSPHRGEGLGREDLILVIEIWFIGIYLVLGIQIKVYPIFHYSTTPLLQ
jgi:hypothetical protein